MRVPSRYQTPWGYAVAAFLTAFIFLMLFFTLVFREDALSSLYSHLGLSLVLASSALPTAFLAWPRRTRKTKLRIMMAGGATVMMAFALIGFVVSIMSIIEGGASGSLAQTLTIFVMAPVVFVVFGSIFTLGIPYILGLIVSLLFREDLK